MAVSMKDKHPTSSPGVILEIHLPGLNIDDLHEDLLKYGGNLLDELLEEIMDQVGLTIVTLPGQKCMADDRSVTCHHGTIVGAKRPETP